MMSKLRRAREIHRKEGLSTLISEFSNYVKNRIKPHFRPKYYTLKSSILGSQIVNINNVLIDLDDDVFSPAMKTQIRRKRYEHRERELITTHIDKNRPVIDLGAGVGYTACLLDRETDNSTPIVAVEANKSLIPVIERTKNLNQCEFNVLYSAYDSAHDSVEFQIAKDFWSSSQYDMEDKKQRNVVVPAASLDEILEKYGIENQIQLIADIEGGEHDLLTNEHSLLQNRTSLIIFEYHSFTEEPFSYYKNILTENGFEFVESQGNVYVFQNGYL